MNLATALSWIARVQGVELPAEEERLVELCAESAAIVAGYAMSPEMEEGQYAVVDIGAWTTEMSFFRFSESGRLMTGRPLRAFHAARSHRIAANQVDDRCHGNLCEMYEADRGPDLALTETIRGQRERSRFGVEPIPLTGRPGPVTPRASALRFAQDVVAESLALRFQQTLAEAYEMERFESLWRGQLRVLLAGGGSLDEVLRSGIRHSFVVDVRVVPAPSDLVGLPDEDDYRRFLVAYGLAHGSARWPRDLLPSQTLPFRPRSRSMTTFEELGYGQ